MNKKSVKVLLISIMTVMFILLNTQNCTVEAKFFNVNEVELYSKEEAIYLIYNNMRIGTEFVVYNMDGVEYPAYCLNRELSGITGDFNYNVEVQEQLENPLVWRAIINGYPYKNYSQLGCNSELEAFVATKLTVYNMLYNYDLAQFTPIGEEGKRVLEAMKKISEVARNSQENFEFPEISIVEESEWQTSKDNNYREKTYKINSNIKINNYYVDVENEIAGLLITDADDNNKEFFNQEDLFKIKIPIEKLNQKHNLKYQFSINIENKAIVYGKSMILNKQNYALTGRLNENVDIYSNDEISKNDTKLVIEKCDKSSKTRLEKTVFSIWDNKGIKLKDNVVTNDEGIIEINELKPGKYFIQEVQPTEGYIMDDTMFEINIEYGETKRLIIENEKKQKQEIKETKVEKEEIKLPRTGR